MTQSQLELINKISELSILVMDGKNLEEIKDMAKFILDNMEFGYYGELSKQEVSILKKIIKLK